MCSLVIFLDFKNSLFIFLFKLIKYCFNYSLLINIGYYSYILYTKIMFINKR